MNDSARIEWIRNPIEDDDGGALTIQETKRVLPDGFLFRSDIGPLLAHARNAIGAQGMWVVHVTAATAREGVSTVARELTHAAAAMPWCRPLLIDRNPGPNDRGTWFGGQLPALVDAHRCDRKRLNVAAVETGDVIFHAARVPPELIFDNTFEAPAKFAALSWSDGGARQEVPAAIRANRVPHSPDATATTDLLRKAFNLVVVDCPPVLQFSPFLPLARELADVLLVIRADYARLSVISAAKQQLSSSGCNISGVVINRFRRRVPRLIGKLL